MTVFFNSHQITIYRRRRKGQTHRWGMSATGTVWNADIQPASAERISQADGKFGQVYTGFVDVDCDIKEGDQIDVDGKRYGVKGVANYRGAGLLDHKELMLVSQDSTEGSNG